MPLFLGKDKITRVIMSVESADGGTNTNDATLSSGAQMLKGVTAYSKGTKYTGTIATVEGPTPDISVSSDGLIAASVSNPKGYQAGSTTKTATQQLTTKGATTITPSSASQIAVNSGVYTTGKITVSAVPTETKKITANGTYSPSAGKYFSSVEVAIAGDTLTYQSKTISPSTSVQTVTADSGYDALSDVTVNAIQTETKSVTSNGTYKPTNGKYFSSVTVNVPSETFNTQTKTVTPTESTQTVSPDNGYNGLSTVTVNPISSTYIGSAVPTKGATTITPNSNSQTAISSGTYATGNIIVSAVPSETKEITSNGTYAPTSGKWFSSVTVDVPSSGIDTSDATATADDIVKDKTAYVKGEKITGTVHEVPSGYYMNTLTDTITSSAGEDVVRMRGQLSDTYNFLFRKGSYVQIDMLSSKFGDATAADVAAGKTFTSSDGFKVTGTATISGSTPTLQTKSVTPTESEQIVTPDAGYDGLSSVTVGAISSTYIGSGVTRKSADTITPSESTQTIAANQYLTGIQTISAIPSDYVGSGITRKSAATITPTTTNQTINAGQYLSGAQTIKGDRNLVPENIISGKSIFGVSGSVVIQKYYTGTSDPSSSLGNDGDIYLKA